MSHTEIFSRDVEKCVLAAERLMVYDVRPHLLPESDRAAVRYYLQCLSEKFYVQTQEPMNPSQFYSS